MVIRDGGCRDLARDLVEILRHARRLLDIRANVRLVRSVLDALERITAEGGTLDQIESLSATIASVRPVLDELGPGVQAIAETAARLSEVASPIGDLAGWFPPKRRRPRSYDVDSSAIVLPEAGPQLPGGE